MVVALPPVAVVLVALFLEGEYLVAFQWDVLVLVAYDLAVVDSVVDNNPVPSTMGHSVQNDNKLNHLRYHYHLLKNN